MLRPFLEAGSFSSRKKSRLCSLRHAQGTALVFCQGFVDGYRAYGGVHLFFGGLHLNQGTQQMEATVKVDSINPSLISRILADMTKGVLHYEGLQSMW